MNEVGFLSFDQLVGQEEVVIKTIRENLQGTALVWRCTNLPVMVRIALILDVPSNALKAMHQGKVSFSFRGM